MDGGINFPNLSVLGYLLKMSNISTTIIYHYIFDKQVVNEHLRLYEPMMHMSYILLCMYYLSNKRGPRCFKLLKSDYQFVQSLAFRT